MLAYEPGVAVAYDIALIALSLVLAGVITGAGFSVAIGEPGLRRSCWPAPSSAAASPACITPACGRSNFRAGHVGPRSGHRVDPCSASVLGSAAMAVATCYNMQIIAVSSPACCTLAIVSHHFTAMGAVEVIADPTRSIHRSHSTRRRWRSPSRGARGFDPWAQPYRRACRPAHCERDLQLMNAVNNMSQGS